MADAAGGAPDQLARVLAKTLSENLGQQVVVDNRPGAAGALGADIAARSPADGYTLLLTTTAIYAILPSLKKNLSYDPVRDFAPVSRIATASNVLVVNNALPVLSVGDLVRLAKSKPGVLNYASAGVGSPAHLAGEMLNLLAGIKLTHVPYKGAAPGLLDVIAGNAQLIITSPIAAGAHMSGGRVRALATTGAERNPRLPELPTVADTVPVEARFPLARTSVGSTVTSLRLTACTGSALRYASLPPGLSTSVEARCTGPPMVSSTTSKICPGAVKFCFV